jgi:kinesin family protein 1
VEKYNPGLEFADQSTVYDSLGREMLEHAFSGYNVCIFAYGQTGSGKSYSMMGAPGEGNHGIIPRMCEELFDRIAPDNPKRPKDTSYECEVSYLEIYNEKVRILACCCLLLASCWLLDAGCVLVSAAALH